MKIIDTHTHINLRAFKDDADQTIQRALDSGVAIVNVGTQIDTSEQAVKLLEKFAENVYATVGLHPTHSYDHDFIDEDELQIKTREQGFDYEAYKKLAKNPRVVGIGECGLDYFRLPDDRDHSEIKKIQREVFEQQIKLAIELDKALCIHCRPSQDTNDAYEDLLEILTKTKSQHAELRFEVHCYTGDLETAKKFTKLGGFIGLNGIITFDKSGRSEDVVKNVYLEHIILETDAPYLSPKSMRGKRNEPSYLHEVAAKIAEWKNITLEEVEQTTTANAKKLFKL